MVCKQYEGEGLFCQENIFEIFIENSAADAKTGGAKCLF
jgi:hypothetical protein